MSRRIGPASAVRAGRSRRITGVLLGAGALVVVGLAVVAPPTRLPGQLVDGVHATDGGAALVTAAVGIAVWALVGWLTLSIVAAYAARLPGAAGRLGQATCARITPALVGRLIGGGAAVGIALGPSLLPVAAQAAPTLRPGLAVTQAAQTEVPCAAGGNQPRLPSLDRPAQLCPAATSPTVAPSAESARATAASHVVVPGDTLWGLAATQLRTDGIAPTPARVAASWPAWWATNRAEVGADPGVLRPGQVLRTPPA